MRRTEWSQAKMSNASSQSMEGSWKRRGSREACSGWLASAAAKAKDGWTMKALLECFVKEGRHRLFHTLKALLKDGTKRGSKGMYAKKL